MKFSLHPLILSVAVLSFLCSFSVAAPPQNPIKTDIHISGDELTEQDLEGKVVVVHQWMAHCGACPPSLKNFEKLARRKKKSGATFLIWHGVDTPALAKEKSDDLKLKLPVYQGRIIKWDTAKFGNPVWPHVLIIDQTGEVVYMGEADRKFTRKLRELTKKS